MNEAIRTILIMSITGGIVAIMLFALKPLVRNRLPKSAQYYLWLVVIAALLVPISRIVVLRDGGAMPVAPIQPVVAQNVLTAAEERERISSGQANAADAPPDYDNPAAPAPAADAPADYDNPAADAAPPANAPAADAPPGNRERPEQEQPRGYVSAVTVFMFAYPFGAAIALLYFIVSYIAFTWMHSRRNKTANADELAMLAKLCKNRRTRIPRLYRNPLAATPMLFGVFRPAIILPDREYTGAQLRAVLLHELAHLRRKDLLVKWLSILACAVHWFNPVVWLVRREIDRACELACDEAVIRGLDSDGKQEYGETLIYVAADSRTPHAVLSTTMCEEKKDLKERLGAIMKSKKHSRLTLAISAALLLSSVLVACALGAGRAANQESTGSEVVNPSEQMLGEQTLGGQTLGEQMLDGQTLDEPPLGTQLPAPPSNAQPSPQPDLPAQVMHNGVIYYHDGTPFDIEVSPSPDAPRITSTVPRTEVPQIDGQANFEPGDFGGMGPVYVVYSNGLFVYWDDRWEWFISLETPETAHLKPGAVPFGPDDIFDLVSAELAFEDGRVLQLDDEASVKWLESSFGKAVEADPTGCPFWAVLYLTREDGVVGTVQPAMDSCRIFRAGGVYYKWGSGTNEDFFALFGATDYNSLRGLTAD